MNDIPKGNNFREITLVDGQNSVCSFISILVDMKLSECEIKLIF